jgi:hypothetical protein
MVHYNTIADQETGRMILAQDTITLGDNLPMILFKISSSLWQHHPGRVERTSPMAVLPQNGQIVRTKNDGRVWKTVLRISPTVMLLRLLSDQTTVLKLPLPPDTDNIDYITKAHQRHLECHIDPVMPTINSSIGIRKFHTIFSVAADDILWWTSGPRHAIIRFEFNLPKPYDGDDALIQLVREEFTAERGMFRNTILWLQSVCREKEIEPVGVTPEERTTVEVTDPSLVWDPKYAARVDFDERDLFDRLRRPYDPTEHNQLTPGQGVDHPTMFQLREGRRAILVQEGVKRRAAIKSGEKKARKTTFLDRNVQKRAHTHGWLREKEFSGEDIYYKDSSKLRTRLRQMLGPNHKSLHSFHSLIYRETLPGRYMECFWKIASSDIFQAAFQEHAVQYATLQTDDKNSVDKYDGRCFNLAWGAPRIGYDIEANKKLTVDEMVTPGARRNYEDSVFVDQAQVGVLKQFENQLTYWMGHRFPRSGLREALLPGRNNLLQFVYTYYESGDLPVHARLGTSNPTAHKQWSTMEYKEKKNHFELGWIFFIPLGEDGTAIRWLDWFGKGKKPISYNLKNPFGTMVGVRANSFYNTSYGVAGNCKHIRVTVKFANRSFPHVAHLSHPVNKDTFGSLPIIFPSRTIQAVSMHKKSDVVTIPPRTGDCYKRKFHNSYYLDFSLNPAFAMFKSDDRYADPKFWKQLQVGKILSPSECRKRAGNTGSDTEDGGDSSEDEEERAATAAATAEEDADAEDGDDTDGTASDDE